MRRVFLIALSLSALSLSPTYASLVFAESTKIEISDSEDLRAALQKLSDKSVTVVLESDKEITGKVHKVTDKLLHLSEISGRDFYDAIINLEDIHAIVVRARG